MELWPEFLEWLKNQINLDEPDKWHKVEMWVRFKDNHFYVDSLTIYDRAIDNVAWWCFGVISGLMIVVIAGIIAWMVTGHVP